MALYEITIGNRMDDSYYTKLVLSEEPLFDDSLSAKSIAGLDEGWGEYIAGVRIASVFINSWDSEEHNKLTEIRNLLL